MDSELLEIVIQKALDEPEIAGRLEQVARDNRPRLIALRDQLADFIRAHWAGHEHEVGRDIERYEDSQISHSVALAEVLDAYFSNVQANVSIDVALQTLDGAFDHLLSLQEHELNYTEARNSPEEAESAGRSNTLWTRWPSGRSMRPDANTVPVELSIERRYAKLQLEPFDVAELLIALDQRDRAAATRGGQDGLPLTAIRSRMLEARRLLIDASLEIVVLPMLRPEVEAALGTERKRLYRMQFDTTDTSGMRQMMMANHMVPTDAFEELASIAKQLDGGVIGVSGPRGIGKTTLIRSTCDFPAWLTPKQAKEELVGVFIPAPVEYVPGEFLSHAFKMLCHEAVPELDPLGGVDKGH